MAHSLPFAEGGSINRPPLFCGENYPFWKVRMQIFMESIDRGIWKIVQTGFTEPDKPYEEWTVAEKGTANFDAKAKNIIHSALNSDEFFRISACTTAKEMWDHIQVVHEGTEDVKRSRKNTLIQEYETFRMQKGETIADVQKRFTHIVNHLKGLGKKFDEEEMNVKVLKSLDRTWQAKVTAIAESKNLSLMQNAELFGKLREHEMDLQRLSSNEEKDKKQKGLALKSKILEEDSESDNEDDESMSLMVRKFKKFMRRETSRRPRFEKKHSSQPKKHEEQPQSIYTCYECGKPGHIKSECPDRRNKRNGEKEAFKKGKKKAYITWDDTPSTSSNSESDSDEEANICFISQCESDTDSSEVSSSSKPELTQENFDELLIAFNEMHAEAEKFSKLNKGLKSQIRVHVQNCKALEEKVHALEKENEVFKTEKEELSSKASDLATMLKQPCENCKSLKQKIDVLENSLARFSKAKSDLNFVLDMQRSMSDRTGLGYKNVFYKHKQKPVFKSFQKHKRQTSPTPIVCHYCMHFGHISPNCYIKKYGIPQGQYTWVKKTKFGITNNNGPKTIWVPKSL